MPTIASRSIQAPSVKRPPWRTSASIRSAPRITLVFLSPIVPGLMESNGASAAVTSGVGSGLLRIHQTRYSALNQNAYVVCPDSRTIGSDNCGVEFASPSCANEAVAARRIVSMEKRVRFMVHPCSDEVSLRINVREPRCITFIDLNDNVAEENVR